jgi:hypothetical protein
MLLAEDLLLLFVDDVSGKAVTDATRIDHALAAAVLLDLALRERVGVPPGERKAKLAVLNPAPTGDEVLDEALRRVADKAPKKPDALLPELAKKLRPALLGRLTERGILRQEQDKILGIFPTTQWPAEDSSHERAVRDQLSNVLIHGIAPEPRTAALISLLSATDTVTKVLGPDTGVPKKELNRRAKEIGAGNWAGDAVKASLDAINTVMLATTVAIAGGTVIAGS